MAEGTLQAEAPSRRTPTNDAFRTGKIVDASGLPRYKFTSSEGGPTTTRDRQANTKDIGERSAGVPKEMRENYYNFVETEFSKLLTLANGIPAERQKYDRMINHPAYEAFKVVLEKYSILRPGSEEAGVPIRTLDVDALKNYILNTREGFLDAYELRYMSLRERTMSRGIKLSDNLPPPGPESIENQDIRTGKGGIFREPARSFKLFMGNRLTTHGRDTPPRTPIIRRELPTYGAVTEFLTTVSAKSGALGAALGAVIGGPPGAIAGGAAGVAMPLAIAGLVHAFHDGERVTIKQVRSALETVNQGFDGDRRLWAKEMYNTASTNREWRRGEVRMDEDIIRGRRLAQPEMSADKALGIITEEQKWIVDTQKVWGIPRELQGATNNWFSPPDSRRNRDRQRALAERQFVQRDLPLEILTDETLMHELRYRDPPGTGPWVPCQVEVDPLGVALALGAPRTGLWEDNVGQFNYPGGGRMPAFDLRYLLNNTNEIQEQRERIHRRLFVERFRNNSNRINELEKGDRIDLLGITLTERREAYAEGGTVARERTVDVDEQDRLLTEDKNGLQEEIGSLTAITTDLENITKARATESKARGEIRNVNPPVGAILRPRNTDELIYLNDVLTDRAGNYSITITHDNVTQTIESIQYQFDQAQNEYRRRVGLITTGTPAAQQAAIEREDRNLERVEAAINAQITAITESMQRIRDAQTNVNETQETLSNKADRIRIQEITRGLETARNTLMTWNVPAVVRGFVGIDLSQAALSAEVDPSGNPVFDVLMQRINDINTLSAAGFVPPGANAGWPPEENNRADRRMMLLHAMAEARAGNIQPLVANPTPEFGQAIDTTVGAAIGDMSGWNIREADILVMSRSQLEALFRQRNTDIGRTGRIPPGAMPNAAELTALQEQAQLRFQARQQRLQELSNEIEGRGKRVATEKTRILEEVARTPELDFIGKMRSRIGEIGKIITTMTEAELIRELDPGPPNARTTRPYEMAPRTPGAAPTTGADIWFAELLSGSRTDDVEFRSAIGVVTRGNLGAWNRAREYIDPDTVMQEQNDFFNLQMPGGLGTPATPDEAWNAIRTGLADGTITKNRFAEFTINRWILFYMGRRAAVA